MEAGASEPADSKGVWASGHAYDVYMGRWSRAIAAGFLRRLAVSPRCEWLDVGCGTGAVSAAIVKHADPARVVAVDRSDGFLTFARERVHDRRVEWLTGDAARLSLPDRRFDVAISGLVLNFLPDPAAVVREMTRLTRMGGIVSAYVWDYGGRMEILRPLLEAAIALDREAHRADEALRSRTWEPATLATLFGDCGLEDVWMFPVDIRAVFESFEEYWGAFLGGQGTVGSYILSLAEGAREELRRRVAARIPAHRDGSLSLRVRAWGVAGRRPEGDLL